MKPVSLFFIFSFFIVIFSCKKESVSKADNDNDVQLSATHTNGPIRNPIVDYERTTPTQFIATEKNAYSDFVLKFSAKKPGITITSFKFLAYESNIKDAYSIQIDSSKYPGFFSYTTDFGNAKAKAKISNVNIKLHDNGTSTRVTFRVNYNRVSGDTVSVKLISVKYFDNASGETLAENLTSSLSPKMMITLSKPYLSIDTLYVSPLQVGLTEIFAVNLGGNIRINNLPLTIKATNVNFGKNLVVTTTGRDPDEVDTLKTTTVRDGNHYTIQFIGGITSSDMDPGVSSLNVYANVKKISGKASLQTHLQNASNFSWTDIDSYNLKPFTVENGTYYFNYPATVVTTHN
jgi:hypothetical protein